MQYTDEAEWNATVEANQGDFYGMGVIQLARNWAEEMEPKLDVGEKLADIADDAFRKIDEDQGYTGFMYGVAVSILTRCWKYGEDLRRWSNRSVAFTGEEAERANARPGVVLNPALLNIVIPEGSGPDSTS